MKEQEIRKDAPSVTRKTFLYNLSRSSYEKDWGSTYERPGIGSKVLAFGFRIVPKVGPFKALAFKRLTPETEKMYMASFNSTTAQYRELLSEQNAGRLKLPNDNLDVGTLTAAGKYQLTDTAYSRLLHKLDGHYAEMPQELRKDILAFYRDLNAPISTKADGKDWAIVLKELDQLKAVDVELRQPAVAAVGASLSR
jgi:hypothetical protein